MCFGPAENDLASSRETGGPSGRIGPPKAAFTLIELLVVISIIAILAAILLPVLNAAMQRAHSAGCMSNTRQIMVAWSMYADDNNNILAPNDYPYTTCYATATAQQQGEMKNWVVGTMEQNFDASGPLASKELTCQNTLLSPYLPNAALYHCPADLFINPASHAVDVRSYSMNSAVGTLWWTSFNGGPPLGSPVQGGWLTGTYNASQTTWQTYGKMSSIRQPAPSDLWVIMDENPYSINDGSLAVAAAAAPGATYLIDYPAGNHGDASGISFADGHSIIHKWQDGRTTSPENFIEHGMGSTTATHMNPDDPDCFYLAPLTSALRQ